jgi:hypothetical protein
MPESKKTFIKSINASVQKQQICFQEPRIQCLVCPILFAKQNIISSRCEAKLKQTDQQKLKNRQDFRLWLNL